MPVKAKFWITVKASRSTYAPRLPDGGKAVDAVKPKQVTINKPTLTEPDSEAIEIEIEFPDGYFDTNNPKIEVVLPTQQSSVITAAVKARKQSSAAATVFHSGGTP